MMIPTPNTKELRIAISITMVDINYVREYWASTRFKAHLRVDFWRKPHGEDLFFRPRKRAKPRTKSKLLLIYLLYHMNNDYIYIYIIYIYVGLLRWGCRDLQRRRLWFGLQFFCQQKRIRYVCIWYIYIHMYIHTLGQFFDFWFRKSDCRRCDCRVGSSLGMHFPPHAAWGDLLMAVCWKWQHSKFQWVSRVIFQWASILDWKLMKPLQFGQNPFVFPTLAVLNTSSPAG